VISPPKIEMPENSALAYARPVLASAEALTDCDPVETMNPSPGYPNAPDVPASGGAET
jgi:hypothetical protein